MRFEEINESVLEHFKGGAGALRAHMTVDENNRFMRGCLKSGSSIGLHTHEGTSEILYVISGVGTAILDGVEETLQAGDYHYCPMGHAHTLINRGTEDLVFFAVIPQHELPQGK